MWLAIFFIEKYCVSCPLDYEAKALPLRGRSQTMFTARVGGWVWKKSTNVNQGRWVGQSNVNVYCAKMIMHLLIASYRSNKIQKILCLRWLLDNKPKLCTVEQSFCKQTFVYLKDEVDEQQ